jgi:2Fe-2S ferredoxin
MPTVILIAHDGARTELEVPAGESVMHAAVHRDARGITGQCGGMLTCATCHVTVEPEWADRLPPPMADEDEMLEFTAVERGERSRLSCQIVMTAGLDGLVLRTPPRQE